MRRHFAVLVVALQLCAPPARADEKTAPRVDLDPFEIAIMAPDIDLRDNAGVRRSLADLGGKVVVVNFWATWCGPCREEFPALDRAAQALAGDRVAVLGVNVGDKAPFVQRFLDRTPVGFPILLDADSRVARAWNVLALPATFVVAPDGTLHGAALGIRAWDHPEMLARLRSLAGR